ncbi:MAG: hypothetical protein KDD02_18455 [Phaeodactylibacter sp.]|nr:hypothetical protein [Phaeodactylibacter sp.]MCB9299920.1 hypothetical protein [Lewinellaceae bacterium]
MTAPILLAVGFIALVLANFLFSGSARRRDYRENQGFYYPPPPTTYQESRRPPAPPSRLYALLNTVFFLILLWAVITFSQEPGQTKMQDNTRPVPEDTIRVDIPRP